MRKLREEIMKDEEEETIGEKIVKKNKFDDRGRKSWGRE